MAAYDPIKAGSAALNQLVPEVGAQIQTNEFGTDTIELVGFFGDASIVRDNRPRRGDLYSGAISLLQGFTVDDHKVQLVEGTACKLRVTYMKPNPDVPYRIKIASQMSGPLITASNPEGAPYYFDLMPRPDVIVTKTYNLPTRPNQVNGRALRPGSAGIEDFPDIPLTFLTPANAALLAWFNTSLDPIERCNKTFYEIEETWRPVLMYNETFPS